jgi:hypothetical protein
VSILATVKGFIDEVDESLRLAGQVGARDRETGDGYRLGRPRRLQGSWLD